MKSVRDKAKEETSQGTSNKKSKED